MAAWDEDDKPLSFTAAELTARLRAGMVDFAAQLLLVALYFAFPLITGGAALPIWGVFAAVVGYSVVPLALYGATPGMALFELEMVSPKGRTPQVTDLLFRELLGRGYFPLAYLGSLVVALVGAFLGLTRFTMPVGMGLVLFILSFVLLFVALVGNIIALVRPDGRTLADLIARTVVIPKRALTPPKDEDERDQARRDASRKMRALVISEVCMVALGIGFPYLVSRRVPGEDTGTYAERLTREKLQHQFEADPGNERLANDLAAAFERVGQYDQVTQVRERYRAAQREKNAHREQLLRAQLAQDASNQGAASELLELLEVQGRKDDARAVYAAFVAADPSAEKRAAFGIWLYQTGFSDGAVAELTTALDGGFEDAETRAYLGFAHKDLHQFKEARSDFQRALELDPSLQEVEAALAETMAQ